MLWKSRHAWVWEISPPAVIWKLNQTCSFVFFKLSCFSLHLKWFNCIEWNPAPGFGQFCSPGGTVGPLDARAVIHVNTLVGSPQRILLVRESKCETKSECVTACDWNQTSDFQMWITVSDSKSTCWALHRVCDPLARWCCARCPGANQTLRRSNRRYLIPWIVCVFVCMCVCVCVCVWMWGGEWKRLRVRGGKMSGAACKRWDWAFVQSISPL